MKTLYSTEENFEIELTKFISKAKNKVIIIVPYIKTKILEKILQKCNCEKIIIITTWKLRDMQFGSSELELYNFCKNNNIFLFINQRVHLKSFIIDNNKSITGSANISNKGLAIMPNFLQIFSIPQFF